MEKEKQKESSRRSSWPWKRKSSEKVAATNSFAPHEGGGTFLNSPAAVVEDRQQVLQQQQQQAHFPILLRSCRLCLRSIIHHLSCCTAAAAAIFPKFFCLWFLQHNKSISIGAQYVTLEIYTLNLGELETRDPSPYMSCKDHM